MEHRLCRCSQLVEEGESEEEEEEEGDKLDDEHARYSLDALPLIKLKFFGLCRLEQLSRIQSQK